MMETVSRILIYRSENKDRLIKALLNRYVKGKVVFSNGDTIEEKLVMDNDDILKSLVDDLKGGGHGNG